MEILKWEDQTWKEIPIRYKLIKNEECLIICKQEYVKPPKINTGEWEVLHWRQDERDQMNWSVCFVGLFWELEDAELFARAMAKKEA